MGIIKQGILGGFSGKVGGVVGSSWKGIAVMKAKPLSVANPRTAGQIAQRTKLSNVSKFAAVILATVIKPLWDRFAQQASGYNDFTRTNIGLFSDIAPSTPSSLVVSSGKMAATPIATAAGAFNATQITLTWADDSGEGLKLATDVAYVVVWTEDSDQVKGFETTAVRSDGTVDVDLDSNVVEFESAHAYLAFKRADGTVVSDSSYKVVSMS